MKDTTFYEPVSYVAWILGQTAAMLGVVLILVWGFGVVFLVANAQFAGAHGGAVASSELWHPPVGPPLAGLGLALGGWLIAHLRHLRAPATVVVGVAANLLALVLAIAAASL